MGTARLMFKNTSQRLNDICRQPEETRAVSMLVTPGMYSVVIHIVV